MLGREVNTPAQLMFPIKQKDNEDIHTYVSELTGIMKEAHEMTRTKLKTSLKRMKRDYDLKVLFRPYAEGDIVYILDTAVLKVSVENCVLLGKDRAS